jgi:hypothetical protein
MANYTLMSSGLYYKHITIVNDDYSVISKLVHIFADKPVALKSGAKTGAP